MGPKPTGSARLRRSERGLAPVEIRVQNRFVSVTVLRRSVSRAILPCQRGLGFAGDHAVADVDDLLLGEGLFGHRADVVPAAATAWRPCTTLAF